VNEDRPLQRYPEEDYEREVEEEEEKGKKGKFCRNHLNIYRVLSSEVRRSLSFYEFATLRKNILPPASGCNLQISARCW